MRAEPGNIDCQSGQSADTPLYPPRLYFLERRGCGGEALTDVNVTHF